MSKGFDLLGAPIPDNHGQPGANGHVPTPESVRKVRLLLVAGLKKHQIADELGISRPTLNKHYFTSGRVNLRLAREMAIAETRARSLLQLDSAASDGNVSAMKEIRKIADQESLKLDPNLPRSRPQPEGKKAETKASARKVPQGLDDLIPDAERPN